MASSESRQQGGYPSLGEANDHAVGDQYMANKPTWTEGDRDSCLKAVKQNGLAMQDMCEAMKQDREVCMEAVGQNGLALNFIPQSMRDGTLTMEAIKQNGAALRFVPQDSPVMRELCFEALRSSPEALDFVPMALREDPEVCIAAVTSETVGSIGFYTLVNAGWLPESMKRNREVCLAAMKATTGPSIILPQMHESMREDREICRIAFMLYPDENVLRWISEAMKEELLADRELCFQVVRESGGGLESMSQTSPFYRELCFEAFCPKNSPHRYEHISEALKADREICKAVIASKGGYAIEDMPESIREDPELCTMALRDSVSVYERLFSDAQKANRELCLIYVGLKSASLENVPDCLRDDPEICRAAFGSTAEATKHMSESMKKVLLEDREYCQVSLKSSGLGLEFMLEPIKEDRECIAVALKQDSNAIQHVSQSREDYREICLEALSKEHYRPRVAPTYDGMLPGACLKHLAESLRADREICLLAFETSVNSFQHASEAIKADRDICLFCFKKDASTSRHMPAPMQEEFLNDRKLCLESLESDGDGFTAVFKVAEWKKDRELVLAALKTSDAAFCSMDPTLKKDEAFLADALQANPKVGRYIDLVTKKRLAAAAASTSTTVSS